ncbi:hypothetical protein Tco_0051610 [Tanacetum coccineum]
MPPTSSLPPFMVCGVGGRQVKLASLDGCGLASGNSIDGDSTGTNGVAKTKIRDRIPGSARPLAEGHIFRLSSFSLSKRSLQQQRMFVHGLVEQAFARALRQETEYDPQHRGTVPRESEERVETIEVKPVEGLEAVKEAMGKCDASAISGDKGKHVPEFNHLPLGIMMPTLLRIDHSRSDRILF